MILVLDFGKSCDPIDWGRTKVCPKELIGDKGFLKKLFFETFAVHSRILSIQKSLTPKKTN